MTSVCFTFPGHTSLPFCEPLKATFIEFIYITYYIYMCIYVHTYVYMWCICVYICIHICIYNFLLHFGILHLVTRPSKYLSIRFRESEEPYLSEAKSIL